MNKVRAALLTGVLTLPFGAAQAESLRCAGGIAAEGDASLPAHRAMAVRARPGQPGATVTLCAGKVQSISYGRTPQ